jgi:hypothetical protein
MGAKMKQMQWIDLKLNKIKSYTKVERTEIRKANDREKKMEWMMMKTNKRWWEDRKENISDQERN